MAISGNASRAVISALYAMKKMKPQDAIECQRMTIHKSSIIDENGILRFIHNGMLLTNGGAMSLLCSGKILNLIGLDRNAKIRTVWIFHPHEASVFLDKPHDNVLELHLE